ncbi:XRE family transcriptional regulator [Pedobacter psychrodurus]|uniref:XRE family transcriptional regulator n=1 Tax=Pedobacter psychrodurus TaxID=2530456 RepID=A0A4R0PZD7_9SPHI|nr:helix-turn-helix transcriptional regulator [Pedobacter psychrodurus]TCD28601.1 XRE family transcriptional regulator [Pedobacter psychrodurus]
MVSEKEKEILKRFGTHLKKLKEARNLSYRQFYANSGVNTGDIIKYENGITAPDFITIKRLAVGLKVHPSELFSFEFGVDFEAGLE